MKKPNVALSAVILALLFAAAPDVGWTTRVIPGIVTGEITATPTADEIEVNHHAYRIKAGTQAARQLISLYTGEAVRMELDGPPGSPTAEVVSIAPQTGG